MEQKERTCLEILEISKPCAAAVNFLSASTGLKKFFPWQLIPSSSLACSCTSTAWTWERTDRKTCVSVSHSISPFYLTNYCHNWRWKSSLMLKKVLCVTPVAVTLPPPRHSLLGLKPLGSRGVPVTRGVPYWLPPHLTQSDRFPSLAGAQISRSRVPVVSILHTI